jgi:hypothetical protein
MFAFYGSPAGDVPVREVRTVSASKKTHEICQMVLTTP